MPKYTEFTGHYYQDGYKYQVHFPKTKMELTVEDAFDEYNIAKTSYFSWGTRKVYTFTISPEEVDGVVYTMKKIPESDHGKLIDFFNGLTESQIKRIKDHICLYCSKPALHNNVICAAHKAILKDDNGL